MEFSEGTPARRSRAQNFRKKVVAMRLSRWTPWLLAGLLLLTRTSVSFAQQEGEKKLVEVTLDLQEVEISEALAQVGKQAGWDIFVTKEVTGKVSLKGEKLDAEKALDQLVEQGKGSWVRFYLIEKPADKRPERTPEKVYELLSNEQRDRIENMPEDQRRQLFQRGGGMFGGGRGGGAGQGGAPAQPGGGQPAAPGGQGGQPQDKVTIDPLRFLKSREYHDKVTVTLKDAEFLAVLDALWQQSGYPVVTEEDLQQKASLEAKDRDLERALDDLCQPLNLKWFRAYLVAKPEELTREQFQQRMEQRREQRWNQWWSDFWSKSPPERQKMLQERIDQLRNIPPDRLQRIQQSRRAARIMERYTNYMTKLTAEQRQEIAPLIREVGRVFGGATPQR